MALSNHFSCDKTPLGVQSSTIDFALCLGATSSERLATRTKVKNNSNAPLEKKDEVVANVIWRFLELRGCVFTRNFSLLLCFHSSVHIRDVNPKYIVHIGTIILVFGGIPF